MKFSSTSIAALLAFCASVNAFPTESSLLESRDAEAKTVSHLRPKIPGGGLTRQEMLSIGRRDAEAKQVRIPGRMPGSMPKLNTMEIARRDAEAKQVRIPGRMPGRMPELARREAELEELDEMNYFHFLSRELDDDSEGVLSLREAIFSPPRTRIGMVVNNRQKRDVFDSYDSEEDILQLREALASPLKTRIGMVVNNRQKRDVFDSYDSDEDILQLREALASPLMKTRIGMVVNNRQRRDLEDMLLARDASPLMKTRIGMVVNNRQRGEN